MVLILVLVLVPILVPLLVLVLVLVLRLVLVLVLALVLVLVLVLVLERRVASYGRHKGKCFVGWFGVHSSFCCHFGPSYAWPETSISISGVTAGLRH